MGGYLHVSTRVMSGHSNYSLSTDLGKPRYLASLNTNIVSEAMSVREQSEGRPFKVQVAFVLLTLALKHFKAGVRQLRKLLDKVSRKANGGWKWYGMIPDKKPIHWQIVLLQHAETCMVYE